MSHTTSIAKYFRMFLSGEFDVAYSPPEIDAIGLLPESGPVNAWREFDLSVKPARCGSQVADFANSNLIARLCSKRLKELIDSMRSEQDDLQWLPVSIADGNGLHKQYFILHFPEPPDVLNLAKDETIYDDASGVLIRPCLSRSKIGNRKLFNIPGLQIATVVAENIKESIEASGFTGMEFTGIRTRD